MPTGADDEADDLGRLPQPLQLGSGSWDPLAGIIFTWQTLRWEFDASAVYQLRTAANDFEAGDEVRLDGSFQYRIVPWGELGPDLPSFVYAVVEANGRWSDNDEVAGETDANSGGTSLHLTPGIQWVHQRWVVEAAVQLPVVQELDGSGLRNDFAARVSGRFKF